MSAAMMTVQENSVMMKRMMHSLQPLLECSLRTTQHVTVPSRSVECKMLDQHLTRPEEEPEEEEEVAEHKTTFLDALQRLEAARKDMCQFVTKNSIIIMHNKVEINYTDLELKKKKKQKTLTDSVKK
jgi:hypothetical protein